MIDADAFNAFEAAGWEARAAEYDTYCWPALTSRLSDALLDSVDAGPDTRVLDIACGPGHLAARGGAWCNGRRSRHRRAMVRIARQRFPRADFREGDAQALPFPDRCFDAVVSNLGLPHFGRPEQAVAQVRRV